jgi:hypothetical protein
MDVLGLSVFEPQPRTYNYAGQQCIEDRLHKITPLEIVSRPITFHIALACFSAKSPITGSLNIWPW